MSTLELFFDLVFAFTLTQLAVLLARHLSVTGVTQMMLVFGVLWWMYGGYAWLTNTRTPDRAPERLLLLTGMAGFLLVGLAIPRGFGPPAGGSGFMLGAGYLVVVVVHTSLYHRVNRNILRIAPFNLCSAVLVIVAGVTGTPASYALWAAALAVQVASPLIAQPGGRFEIRPAHFVERHGALIIVALGESVAAVGIGAGRVAAGLPLAVTAAGGLALSAAAWWTYFGDDDDQRAEQAMARAEPERRPGLALSAYFFAHTPMLLGVVIMASGVTLTIGRAAQPHPAAQALALGGGAALFLAGHAGFRRALRTAPTAPRLITAAFAVATTVLGVTVSAEAQMSALTAGIVVMLVMERRAGRGAAGGGSTGPAAAGGGVSDGGAAMADAGG